MRSGLFPMLLALAASASCVPMPQGVPPATGFANPVLDADFPDPTVIRAPDGQYYAYSTQSERDGRMVNIQVARSSDLVAWQHLGDALPAKPRWAERTQDFWAPHVAHHDGTYYLYYSAKPDAALTDEKRGLCLAVATALQPQGPFKDIGTPLRCGPGFVNIDPMTFDDAATGKRLLYWGSGFEPIRVQELAPDRVSFAPGSKPIDLVRIDSTDSSENYERLVEGAWVERRGAFYYLFYSGDNCCGKNIHYATMVARARSATGPFETLEQARAVPSSVILKTRGRWVSPGHNSIITDARGQDWIAYHAVDATRSRRKPGDEVNTRRVMLIDRVSWRNGWPVVEGPSEAVSRGPALPRRR